MNTKYRLRKRKILCAFLIAIPVMALFVPEISAKRNNKKKKGRRSPRRRGKHADKSSKKNFTKNKSTKNNRIKNNSKPNTSIPPIEPLTGSPLNSSKPLQNITGEKPGNTDPTVDYIRASDYSGARLDPSGIIATGNIVRMYVEASDAETASDSLTVDISYMPQGGSWTTVAATHHASSNYWYVDWLIPEDADLGLYDVKGDVSNGNGGSASATQFGEYEVI